MEIGGDFYDLVPAHGVAAAVIGDVQGHNVTAAGLMGQIRTAVRAYTTVGQAPEEVMRSTNRLLIDLGRRTVRQLPVPASRPAPRAGP